MSVKNIYLPMNNFVRPLPVLPVLFPFRGNIKKVIYIVENDKKSVLGILKIYRNFRKRTPDEFNHFP
jgi:hypothetical protein